ncbi:MAG: hypothetical protein J0L93_10330 [Deltaproteobacteria bacterium]|nr:hypothetical protein [Deltaproteobacteria bacterium]
MNVSFEPIQFLAEGPIAQKLHDIVSKQMDLHQALGSLMELNSLKDKNQNNLNESEKIISASLWTSSLVEYSKLFNTGRRTWLSPDIFDKPPFESNSKLLHEKLYNLRNEHIAHRVDTHLQQIKIIFLLADPRYVEKNLLGVGCLMAKYIGPTLDELKNYIAHTVKLEQWLSSEAEKLKAELIEYGKPLTSKMYTKLKL